MEKTFSIDRKSLLKRFMEYVTIDTTSDDTSTSSPSSARQWDLAKKLKQELEILGLEDVELTEKACVIARLKSNVEQKTPTIAFLSHMDTSDACPGKARPAVWEAYDGRTIKFPFNPSLSLSPDNCPELNDCIGHDIVTGAGDSLLGGDDKAGIAIVMTGLQTLLENPKIKHGPICVCFNPDEEIGHGADAIPVEKLGADFAYTFDSDGRGVYNFETFSADRAELRIKGVPAHPGSAKGKLVNAIKLIAKFINALPKGAAPENTSGRKGFIHPISITGAASAAAAELILRDFEEEGLQRWRKNLEEIVEKLKAQEPRAEFKLEISAQYRNMRQRLELDMRPVEAAKKAIRMAGVKAKPESVRGGTDGSRLTEMGLPTPNIFAGYRNQHSLTEWASVQDMESAVKTMIHLVQLWAVEPK